MKRKVLAGGHWGKSITGAFVRAVVMTDALAPKMRYNRGIVCKKRTSTLGTQSDA